MPSSLLGSAGYIDNTVIIVGVLAFAIGQAGLQYYILNEWWFKINNWIIIFKMDSYIPL